jgi:hypothetical protein
MPFTVTPVTETAPRSSKAWLPDFTAAAILPEGEMAEQLIELEAARSLMPLSLESSADARIFCMAAAIMADKILRVRPIIIWRTKERIECGSQTVRRSRLGLIGPHP